MRSNPTSCWHFRAMAVAILLACFSLPLAMGQQQDTIPSRVYYAAVERLYEGKYRDAERTFRRELRGAIKTVSSRWIDSICYHSMLGEAYYHQGRRLESLEQFNAACGMYLQHSSWLLRVRFATEPRPSASLTRRPLPWGKRGRTFPLVQLSRSMLVAIGQIDNSAAANQGGVIQQAQYWKVDIAEIVRTTALAIRRRNELLGSLGAHDQMSRELVARLSNRPAPPNHWSGAWIDLQLAMAMIGTGQVKEALPHLERATLLAGKYDYRLTCVALVEQGRLLMESGNPGAAATALAEASYLAFYYDDYGTLDDAFRFDSVNRLVGATAGVGLALEPAAQWARRKRIDHLAARIRMAMAEQAMQAGNWDAAQALLQDGISRLRDARTGPLGNRSIYLDARIGFRQRRDSADATLATAVENQMGMSSRNLRIQLANTMFDSQQLTARQAVGIYGQLLADPTPADMVYRLLDSLAAMKTVRDGAFDRWLAALVSRKEITAALEVTDLAKRHRYLRSLPWGGRLAALRDLLEKSPDMQTPREVQWRNDLLIRLPAYDQARKQGRQLVGQLRGQWRSGMDDSRKKQLARAWNGWSDTLLEREAMLRNIGLSRAASESTFPPRITTEELKSRLRPGQALLVFHHTAGRLDGFLVTAKAHTHWNLGPTSRLSGLLSKYLRDLGNIDAQRTWTTEQLLQADYRDTGNKLNHAIFDDSSIDPKAITELIVIPDHLMWYVPFETLMVESFDPSSPWITKVPVRYAPTIGLGLLGAGGGEISSGGRHVRRRRIDRTGLLVGEMVSGEKGGPRYASVEAIRQAVPGPIELTNPLPAPTPLVGAMLDSLVVLDPIETNLAKPLSWSPLPIGRGLLEASGSGRSGRRGGGGGTLEGWLALPQFGPQQVLLPYMHTPAERGLKISRRRGNTGNPGNELFFASCSMMSTGAQTILLSRWSTGGQSSLDLMREFIQELPHTTAAAAWRRSVLLAMETPIDPLAEIRVEASDPGQTLTGAHPFFWGGYLVVDTGTNPPKEDVEEDAEGATMKQDGQAGPDEAGPPAPEHPKEADPEAAQPEQARPEESLNGEKLSGEVPIDANP